MGNSKTFLQLEYLGLVLVLLAAAGMGTSIHDQISAFETNALFEQSKNEITYTSKRIEAELLTISNLAQQLISKRDLSINDPRKDAKLIDLANSLIYTHAQIDSIAIESKPESFVIHRMDFGKELLEIKTIPQSSPPKSIQQLGVFRGMEILPPSVNYYEETYKSLLSHAPRISSSFNAETNQLQITEQWQDETDKSMYLSLHLFISLPQHIQKFIQANHAADTKIFVEGKQIFPNSIDRSFILGNKQRLAGSTFTLKDGKESKSFNIINSVHDTKFGYQAQSPVYVASIFDFLGSFDGFMLIIGLAGVFLIFSMLKLRLHLIQKETSVKAQQLALSSAKLDTVLKDKDTFLYEVGPDGRFTEVSPNVVYALGYTPSELINKQYFPLVDPRQRITDPLKERKNECIEVFSPFGETIVLELTENIFKDDKGTPIGKYGLARNITRIVESEMLNSLHKENKGALLDAIPDAILTLDYDGKLLEWKSPSDYQFPFIFHPKTGVTLYDVFPFHIAQELELASQTAQKRKQFHHTEVSYQVPNGLYFLEARAITLNANQVMMLLRDITSQKTLEINLASEKAEAQKDAKAKDQFISIISHELRTPLNGILGMSNLLEDTDLSKEQKDYLEKLKLSARSLNSMISDILDFTKIANGEVKINNSLFELPDLLAYVCQQHADYAKDKGLNLVYVIDEKNLDSVKADFGKIAQILTQIVHNAIKFTEVGTVRLTGQIKNNTLNFKVIDTGIGIEDSKLAELFKPFTQVDTSDSRKYSGAGLGLAISTKLVNILDGNIKAENNLEGGTTFSISIPIQKVHEPPLFVSSKTERTALLLDSNPISKSLIKNKLQKEGYQIIDSSKAQDLITVTNPDILLINQFSEPNEDYQKIMQLARTHGIQSVGYRMQADTHRESPYGLEVDRAIILNKTASNLQEELNSIIQ